MAHPQTLKSLVKSRYHLAKSFFDFFFNYLKINAQILIYLHVRWLSFLVLVLHKFYKYSLEYPEALFEFLTYREKTQIAIHLSHSGWLRGLMGRELFKYRGRVHTLPTYNVPLNTFYFSFLNMIRHSEKMLWCHKHYLNIQRGKSSSSSWEIEKSEAELLCLRP